jgi:hypothetical protein
MYVDILWADGRLALMVIGSMATRQFWKAALFATRSNYLLQTHIIFPRFLPISPDFLEQLSHLAHIYISPYHPRPPNAQVPSQSRPSHLMGTMYSAVHLMLTSC